MLLKEAWILLALVYKPGSLEQGVDILVSYISRKAIVLGPRSVTSKLTKMREENLVMRVEEKTTLRSSFSGKKRRLWFVTPTGVMALRRAIEREVAEAEDVLKEAERVRFLFETHTQR